LEMSQSLEELLDATLDSQRQRRHQHEVEQLDARQAIDTAHAKIECDQTHFYTDVRSLIQQAVDRANRHLAKRPERCEFCEISGGYTGPLFACGSACNPISYELCADGVTVGDTLLVELTHDGMIEASLSQPSSSAQGDQTSRTDFGWQPVRLGLFNADTAANLLLRYVAVVTGGCSLGQRPRSDQTAGGVTGDRTEDRRGGNRDR
jgi:hypothetical protein